MKQLDPERTRLAEGNPWKAWGPYLAERQWGTVREDYSADGSAWEYFPHHDAPGRAYRWGEDGLGGFSDYRSRLCLAVALWNGHDPMLKERLFGLSNPQGNHGEDVKEIYYYLDAVPTHSYLRMLYKYPQTAFPYEDLVAGNAARSRDDREYELIDTGVFDDNRYFDVVIEYAKASAEDILGRITVHNRGPDPAPVHVLPHLWFRNTWSWDQEGERPSLRLDKPGKVDCRHDTLGDWVAEFENAPPVYFCENESAAHYPRGAGDGRFAKDAIHRRVVRDEADAVNPETQGTKCAAHYQAEIAPGDSFEVRFRLRRTPEAPGQDAFPDFDATLGERRTEADLFYAALQSDISDDDAREVQRQALAGMIWNKQFYHYDLWRWLQGDPTQPPVPEGRAQGRNREWDHLYNADILSMPDTWEYPWYAAWDLAFHTVPLSMVDPAFAKVQLTRMVREWYMHPNGQLPAYEWAFSDVNPPVHAWATWQVFRRDRDQRGDHGDIAFLERVYHKLLVNFTWWVNQKDADGNNVFQGGFLGLDNIGVFDRSQTLPTGGHIDQSDGTAWMAMYSLNMMRIGLELALHNPVYEDIASKFFEHFLHIAESMTRVGDSGLWDEQDQFFYDWLDLPEGRIPLRVRSMVGLIPLFAVEVLEPELLERLPGFTQRLEWLLEHRPDLHDLVSYWEMDGGVGNRRLLSLLRGSRMKALLRRLCDENEFLSPFGVRALSKAHGTKPFRFEHGGQEHVVAYSPGESTSEMFGGNSNWRGPVWFPVNFLLIESLRRFHRYYGDEVTVECPVGSGRKRTLDQIADEVSTRLTRLFLRDGEGFRPSLGDHPKYREDPRFNENPLFYEYFHGDTGRGLGASHQTGWTGLIANLLDPGAK